LIFLRLVCIVQDDRYLSIFWVCVCRFCDFLGYFRDNGKLLIFGYSGWIRLVVVVLMVSTSRGIACDDGLVK